jgi:predicted DNA-binding transcriptional regulator YafY
MGLLTAPVAANCEDVLLLEMRELAALAGRFADSDCCDTEAFRTIIRRAEELSRRIPPVCGPLGSLVYWVLVVFKTRPADLTRESVRAIAQTLASVRSIWIDPAALARMRARLREAGIRLRPF